MEFKTQPVWSDINRRNHFSVSVSKEEYCSWKELFHTVAECFVKCYNMFTKQTCHFFPPKDLYVHSALQCVEVSYNRLRDNGDDYHLSWPIHCTSRLFWYGSSSLAGTTKLCNNPLGPHAEQFHSKLSIMVKTSSSIFLPVLQTPRISQQAEQELLLEAPPVVLQP